MNLTSEEPDAEKPLVRPIFLLIPIENAEDQIPPDTLGAYGKILGDVQKKRTITKKKKLEILKEATAQEVTARLSYNVLVIKISFAQSSNQFLCPKKPPSAIRPYSFPSCIYKQSYNSQPNRRKSETLPLSPVGSYSHDLKTNKSINQALYAIHNIPTITNPIIPKQSESNHRPAL